MYFWTTISQGRRLVVSNRPSECCSFSRVMVVAMMAGRNR